MPHANAMMTRLFPSRHIRLLLTLALTSCAAVGPNYTVPEHAAIQRPSARDPFIQAAAGAQVTTAPQATSAIYRQDAVPGQWWRLYDNATLDQLVTQALAANTDLRTAAANLERAQAATQEALALQQPIVGVTAGASYGHISGMQELAPKVRPPNKWSYAAGGGVSYQVDLVGQIRRAIEAAQGDAEAAQAAYDATRITVVAETARAYVMLCAAGAQLASAQHSVAVQDESRQVVERLQQGGRGTLLDVTRAKSQLHQLQANVAPFQAQQRVALYRLAALTGQTPGEISPTLTACAVIPRVTQPIPVGDGAALLRRRPDIRQAERSLAANTARIGIVTADLYPKISLGLSGASAGPTSYFGERGTYSWSIGPLISWTIPNTGAVQARIAQAEAGTRAAFAHFDATVLNALRETESILVTYARELDRDTALSAARDQSAQAAAQARQLYRYGKTDYLMVLDAERTLAATETALVASQAALGDEQVTLFLALGGGWEEKSASAPRPAAAKEGS